MVVFSRGVPSAVSVCVGLRLDSREMDSFVWIRPVDYFRAGDGRYKW
jgi:hypothetical protein